MATVYFTSSSAFLERDTTGRAAEHAEVEIFDYIEGTYEMLRHGDQSDGLAFARLIDGAWELSDDRRRFSDWSVKV